MARELGIGSETLRYYESIGIIPSPERTDTGYRVYSETDMARLKFIIKAKKLGFSLREISDVLRLLDISSAEMNAVLKNQINVKIEQIDSKILVLKALREMLCRAGDKIDTNDCGFLDFVKST
jgi:MerR family Zn(II)-responsive transcriptional regulator of zntA